MKRAWQTPAALLAGILMTAVYAMPQAYTISARPGALNYVEGETSLNGKPLSEKNLRATFLNAGDTLATKIGRAEVLLTPGVFLRVGENTQIHMIAPSLTDTQLEVQRGEAIIEADGLLKDNHVAVIDHGASITIEKNGLYRFSADTAPTAAVLEGKAEVFAGDKRLELGKGHEALLADANLKPGKFNTKQEDDLYAWSNVRSEYEAAASYQTANNVSVNSFGGGWGDYGFVGGIGPGWYWNSAFSGYGWMPASGAFYSPFGYGFYAPSVVGYAPIVNTPIYGGGGRGWRSTGTAARAAVPVNPNNPAAVGTVTASPWANHAARMAVAPSYAARGFSTASGASVPAFSGARMSTSSRGGWSGARSGGWSGGHAGSSSGGAAHASGGGMSAGAAGHAGGGVAHR